MLEELDFLAIDARCPEYGEKISAIAPLQQFPHLLLGLEMRCQFCNRLRPVYSPTVIIIPASGYSKTWYMASAGYSCQCRYMTAYFTFALTSFLGTGENPAAALPTHARAIRGHSPPGFASFRLPSSLWSAAAASLCADISLPYDTPPDADLFFCIRGLFSIVRFYWGLST